MKARIPSKRCALGLIFTACLLGASATRAQVLITDGDITGSSYSYAITDTQIGAGNLGAALTSISNISFTATNPAHAFATAGQSTATILLGWDFSGSTYRPTNFSIQDSVGLFSYSPYTKTAMATVEYSTDLSGPWQTLYTVTSTPPEGYSGSSPYVGYVNNTTTPLTGSLALESEFYYRVTFTALASGTFANDTNQWARNLFETNKKFEVAFDVVAIPEPSVALLTGCGLVAVGLVSRRQTRSL